MREVHIPDVYVELCCDWHGGQDDMLYAVASTGNLTLGTIRPNNDDNTPMTDEEWQIYLYECLSCDIGHALKLADKAHEDAYELENFQRWVNATIESLRAE